MISIEEVLGIHEVFERGGFCRSGIRDRNLLMSAVAGQGWYADSLDMLCHVAYNINTSHIFVDGNKCTSFLVILSSDILFDTNRLSDVILQFASNTSLGKEAFFAAVRSCILCY